VLVVEVVLVSEAGQPAGGNLPVESPLVAVESPLVAV